MTQNREHTDGVTSGLRHLIQDGPFSSRRSAAGHGERRRSVRASQGRRPTKRTQPSGPLVDRHVQPRRAVPSPPVGRDGTSSATPRQPGDTVSRRDAVEVGARPRTLVLPDSEPGQAARNDAGEPRRPSSGSPAPTPARNYVTRPRSPRDSRQGVTGQSGHAVRRGYPEADREARHGARAYDRSKYLAPGYKAHGSRRTREQRHRERDGGKQGEGMLRRVVKGIQWPYLIGAIVVVTMVIMFLVKQG